MPAAFGILMNPPTAYAAYKQSRLIFNRKSDGIFDVKFLKTDR